MNNDDFLDAVVIFVLCIIIFISGALLGWATTSNSYKESLVKEGYAIHEEKTGDWKLLDIEAVIERHEERLNKEK